MGTNSLLSPEGSRPNRCATTVNWSPRFALRATQSTPGRVPVVAACRLPATQRWQQRRAQIPTLRMICGRTLMQGRMPDPTPYLLITASADAIIAVV
jgi:hypothetical protein